MDKLTPVEKARQLREEFKKKQIERGEAGKTNPLATPLPQAKIIPKEPITDVDVYQNEEHDEVILYESNMPTIDKIQEIILQQINGIGKNLPEKMKETTIDNAYETALWQYIKNVPVPDALIMKREGSDGKMYDYFPEFFTTAELDRIFPGWWFQDVHTRYDDKSMAYITTGYICIEYVLPSGTKKIRTIYASGGADVFAKKGQALPSQPGDRAAASVTKFIKLAGKRLGIGLELYHDQILPAREAEFGRLIAEWGDYAKPVLELFKSAKKGSGIRKINRILPTSEQTMRLKLLVDRVSKPEVKDALWKAFVQLHRNKADAWLDEWDAKISKKEQEKAEEAKKNEFEYE